jgi:hypothetical protein
VIGMTGALGIAKYQSCPWYVFRVKLVILRDENVLVKLGAQGL